MSASCVTAIPMLLLRFYDAPFAPHSQVSGRLPRFGTGASPVGTQPYGNGTFTRVSPSKFPRGDGQDSADVHLLLRREGMPQDPPDHFLSLQLIHMPEL